MIPVSFKNSEEFQQWLKENFHKYYVKSLPPMNFPCTLIYRDYEDHQSRDCVEWVVMPLLTSEPQTRQFLRIRRNGEKQYPLSVNICLLGLDPTRPKEAYERALSVLQTMGVGQYFFFGGDMVIRLADAVEL